MARLVDGAKIKTLILGCNACELGENPNINCKGIGYHGPDNPTVIFLGEAPGEDEDELGVPFIGKAGSKLRRLVYQVLESGKYPHKCKSYYENDVRDQVSQIEDEYGIVNSARCRPEKNGSNAAPTPVQIKTCTELHNFPDFEKYKPKAIISMGASALTALTGQKSGITKLQGTWGKYTCQDGTDIPVMFTVHPSYLLRKSSPYEDAAFMSDVSKAFDVAYGLSQQVIGGSTTEWYNITTVEQVQWLFQQLSQQQLVAVDIETNDVWDDEGKPDPYKADSKIIGVSFSWVERHGVFLPFNHPQSPWKSETDVSPYLESVEVDPVWAGQMREYIIQNMRQFLAGPVWKIAQNGKFDFQYMEVSWGAPVSNFLMDTMLMHHALDESTGTHGLKIMALRNTDMGNYDKELTNEMGKFRLIKDRRLANVSLPNIAKYGCMDTDATLRLFNIFIKKLQQEGTIINPTNRVQTLDQLLSNFVMPASEVLTRMEITGVKVDTQIIRNTLSEMENRREQLFQQLRSFPAVIQMETEAYNAALATNPPEKIQPDDWMINFSSNAQLGKLLYERMGFQARKTEKGNYTVAAETLQELKAEDTTGFMDALLEYRGTTYFKNTFVLPYLDNPNRVDYNERVHTSFLLHGTVTGRLSSRDPNLQNIPREGTNADIKKFFVASPGNIFVQCDYSQMELRVLAIYSGDPEMIRAYREGHDLHKYVSSLLFGKPLDEVTKPLRQIGKTLNFGLVYGMGPSSLAGHLGDHINEGSITLEDIKVAYNTAQGIYSHRVRNEPKFAGLFPEMWPISPDRVYPDPNETVATAILREFAKLVSALHKISFHGIYTFEKDQIVRAIKNGYVSTLFGRKRRLTALQDDLAHPLRLAERIWEPTMTGLDQSIRQHSRELEEFSKQITGGASENAITALNVYPVQKETGDTEWKKIPFTTQDKNLFLARFLDKTISPKGGKFKGNKHAWELAEAMRQSLNAPIQGSASDICLYSIIRLHHILLRNGLRAKIVLTVHDSIVLDCPVNELNTVLGLVRDVTQDMTIGHEFAPINLDWLYGSQDGQQIVPLVSEISYGYDWKNQTDWDGKSHVEV